MKNKINEEDWVFFVEKCNFFLGANFASGFMKRSQNDSTVEFKEKNKKFYAVVNTTLLETTSPEIFWEFCLRDFGVELSLINNSPWPDAVKNICCLRLGLTLLKPQDMKISDFLSC